MIRIAVSALALAMASPGNAAQPSSPIAVPADVPASLFAGKRSPDILAAQVLLDRAHFSPGVIDGLMGGNTQRAISAYQRARGMPVTGRADQQLLQSLSGEHPGEIFQSYMISEKDVAGPFVQTPAEMADMAKMDRVGYQSPLELLAEKLHVDQQFLRALNPGADFSRAGTSIRTVATGQDRLSRAVTRIEVDKAGNSVRAFADDGSLVARYPATIGSSTFPSPSGSMKVLAVAPDATYHFSPEGRDWGPDETLTIAAGPNNPVGGIWIDLSKEGYGLHGSPDPGLIGKTASHGCVRLTNWDADELAAAVSPGTTVEFL